MSRMMQLDWLTAQCKRISRRCQKNSALAPGNHSRYRRALRLEPLEDRRMLAVFTVDSLLDNFDPNAPTTDGLITLREATLAANSNAAVGDAPAGSGADTIDFSVTGTINLAFGELGITDNLTIDGAGADQLTINAGGNSRIFDVDDGSNFSNREVLITGLTLTGGNAAGDGGAIRSREGLTISDLVVTDNMASGNGGGIDARSSSNIAGTFTTNIIDTVITNNSTTGNDAKGGGIFVITSGGTTTTISGSTISDNDTSGSNAEGGGIFVLNFSTTIISLSTISGNHSTGASSEGGGVYVDTRNGGATTISNTTISGNSTDGSSADGGGIYVTTNSGGMTTITDSTILGNSTNSPTSNADGGGIFIFDEGITTITSSTISGNNSSDDGGGIAVSTSSGNTTIEHSTIAFNTAEPNIFTGNGGGGLFISSGSLTLDHSIVAANTDNSDAAPDIIGTVAATFSLIGDATGATITDNGGNRIGSSVGDLSVSIDLAAMGDFEDVNDSYVFEYSLNGGGFLPLFISDVDEAGSLSYTLEVGSMTTIDDPLQINGTTLDNQFQSLSAVVPGIASGDSLELRFTATSDGTDEAFAFRNITVQWVTGSSVIGRALGPTPDLNVTFVQVDPDYVILNDMFGIRSRTNPGTPSLPDSIADDSVASPPDLGIIQSTDAADFFGVVDTVNSTGNDINVARWTFDIVSGLIDPLLGPLQDNGGPTETHALLPGSPAIDVGDPNFVAPPDFDQRGPPYARVDALGGQIIDIGAVEEHPPPALLGDYNQNFEVDAADYTTWRDTLTAGGVFLPNDPTPGVVDESDFTYWRDHFGDTLGAGSGAGQAAHAEQSAIQVAVSPDRVEGVSIQAAVPQYEAATADSAAPSSTTNQPVKRRHSQGDSQFGSLVLADAGHGGRSGNHHARKTRVEPSLHRLSGSAQQDRLLLAWVAQHDFNERDQNASESHVPWSSQDEESSRGSFCKVADQVFEDLGLGID